MTREVVDHARLWCDGCGNAVIESVADDLDAAADRAGWVMQVNAADGIRIDLCPVCRPDSPFTQVQRVRERAELRLGIPAVYGTYQVGYAAAMYDILKALDGGE